MHTIKLEIDHGTYKKYTIRGTPLEFYGSIVLEKYGDQWSIELMRVFPERQGYGSILLNYVLNDMKCSFTVCPVTNASRNFFKKHGMNDKHVINSKNLNSKK